MTEIDRVDRIDAILPQTQCGDCSYSACKPYARAIAEGEVSIDRCAPGGKTVLFALAEILEIDPTPFVGTVVANSRPTQTAKIREIDCVGCTKCIQACPVDAIIGSAKQMHTILDEECTGCGLCLPPCPVDCIELVNIKASQYSPQKAKARFLARENRLAKKSKKQAPILSKNKKSYIQAAVNRTRKKRVAHYE